MSRRVSATCAAMRTLQRRFAGVATTPACRPGRERAGSLRERRNAGARPKSIPQSSASATENARMGAFMRMTDPAGKESGDSTRGSRASQYDPATPRTAPAQEMTSASTSNWRTMRQRLAPIDVGIAAEAALPEAVVENDDGVAAVLCIVWLDHPAEKGAHAKERVGILCEINARDVFRQPVVGDLQMPVSEAKHRINRGCKAQVIQLCLAKGKPYKLVRMLRFDKVGVHDAVGASVGKWVQQNGVDEGEHCRGGADAEREREHGDGGEAGRFAQHAQTEAQIFYGVFNPVDAAGGATLFFLKLFF